MAKKLYLTFDTVGGKEKNIAISNPKENLSKETVLAAAQVLIEKNAINGNTLRGATLKKAEYKESVTDQIELA